MNVGFSLSADTLSMTSALGKHSPSTDSGQAPCPSCHEECHIPHPLTAEAERVYAALFHDGPLQDWNESDDCQMRNLMRDVAQAAAHALTSPPETAGQGEIAMTSTNPQAAHIDCAICHGLGVVWIERVVSRPRRIESTRQPCEACA